MSAKNRELWQSRVDSYRASSKSAKIWCTENNISVSALRYWITKFNHEKTDSFDNPEFVPISTGTMAVRSFSSATIKFCMISIEISDGCHPDTIRTILDVLRSYD